MRVTVLEVKSIEESFEWKALDFEDLDLGVGLEGSEGSGLSTTGSSFGVGMGVTSVLGVTSTSSASRYHFLRRVYRPQPSWPRRPSRHYPFISIQLYKIMREAYLVIVINPRLISTTRCFRSFRVCGGAFDLPFTTCHPSPPRLPAFNFR